MPRLELRERSGDLAGVAMPVKPGKQGYLADIEANAALRRSPIRPCFLNQVAARGVILGLLAPISGDIHTNLCRIVDIYKDVGRQRHRMPDVSKRQRLLDGLAILVTKRRNLVLGLLLTVTALFASQIPKIQTDPAPENLLSSFEDPGEQITDQFREWFGESDRVIVLLVQAKDVLKEQPLQYVHDLSRHFKNEPWVKRVDSLTVLNLPRRVEGGASEEDDLDLDDLDAIEEEWDTETQDDFETDVMNALLDIIESDPVRFPDGISAVGPKLADELKTDPVIDGEKVTADKVQETKDALAKSPLLVGRLISRDATIAAVALHLQELDPNQMQNSMEALRTDLNARPPPTGVNVYIGGLPYLRSEIVANMRKDNLLMVPITLLVCILLLYIAFRWLPGVFLPIGAVGITALIVVGAMAVVGEPMNILNNIIVPLLIIIGISDSIHLIGRYQEEVSKTGDRAHAGQRTVRAMAVACLLTSLTTAVGLASLVVSRTGMLQHFGVTAAIGVMIAYIVTITFLPSILTWAKPPSEETMREWGGRLEGTIMSLTAWILRRPKFVLSMTAVLVVLSIYAATNIVVDHALLDQFNEEDPVYKTTRLLEDKLDGVWPLEIALLSNANGGFHDPKTLAAIDKLCRWSETRPEVIRTMSHADILRESLVLIAGDPSVRDEPFRSAKQTSALATLVSQRTPNPLSAWLTPDAKQARVQLRIRDIGAKATLQLIDDLEVMLKSELPKSHISYAFTGDAYSGSRGQEAVVRDLLGSLFTAVGIIFVLLSFLFRSVRLGLLSIPPNLIPLIGTMAYMVGRGIPLNVSTVIIFSISLGLAVDGTIHVLARFREETERGLRSNAALIRAARGTGKAIVVSCVTLMAGFGVMLLSSFVPVRQFGELIAVSIAGCLVATMIVQPALLKMAGLSRRQRSEHRAEDERLANAVEAARSGDIE